MVSNGNTNDAKAAEVVVVADKDGRSSVAVVAAWLDAASVLVVGVSDNTVSGGVVGDDVEDDVGIAVA